MEAVIQYLLTGLSVGSVYAMIGLGFVIAHLLRLG